MLAAGLSACATPAPVPSPSPALAPVTPPPFAPEVATGYRAGMRTVTARHHMAAAAHPLATQAGLDMLRHGGSAIDAAVAMQAMLALVEPQSSGLGGGAVILYWDGRMVQAFDGRETAPKGADPRLFLKADGTPMDFRSAQIGGRSVGVPGALRALELVHRQHGRLPWASLFEPAIRAAEDGFAVSPRLNGQIVADRYLSHSPALAAYLLNTDGSPKAVGTMIRNPALARTLRALAARGADALHEGPIAEAIVSSVNRDPNPGSLSLQDLRDYRARERAPLCIDYRSWRLCGMPPPSSGGIAVAQTLGMLQALGQRDPNLALAASPPQTSTHVAGRDPAPQAVHLIAEAERLAFADRALYVADPDFVPLDTQALIDPLYLSRRAALIGARSMGRASAGRPDGFAQAFAADPSPLRISTSQAVAVDDRGGAISMTTTIESSFGSHLFVDGFLLNNQLTDFSFVPDIDGKPVANRVEAGKRPRTSMAPTLVFERDSGQLVGVLGSVGGSQIIGHVVKLLVAWLDWQMPIQEAIGLPNFGSRNGPTEVESGLASPALIESLTQRGHRVQSIDMNSGLQAIVRRRLPDGGWLWEGGADPRRDGDARGE